MKKALSVILILSALTLCGCSDSGKDIELGDFTSNETVRENVPTAPEEIAVPQTTSEEIAVPQTTSEEIAIPQTTAEEATGEAEEEINPSLPEIEYVYLEDADLSHLYNDDEISLINTPGADNVILYEIWQQDTAVQLIGYFVQKRAGASENALFAGTVQVRAVDGEGKELGVCRVEQNYSRHGGQVFYCELDTMHMEDYLKVYTMTQNGKEYLLIAAMQKTLDEEDYDTTFYTVTDSSGLTEFYGVTDDVELQRLITTYDRGRIGGVVLSGDFAVEAESCTLIDNKLGARFLFDFENAAVTVESAE